MWWLAARFFGSEKCANFAENFCGKAHFVIPSINLAEWPIDIRNRDEGCEAPL
jgi:hypothetical protein